MARYRRGVRVRPRPGAALLALAVAISSSALGTSVMLAAADVVAVSGSAYGVAAPPIDGPQPQVSFSNPPDGPGPFTGSLASYALPATGQGTGGIFRASGMSVSTGQVGALGSPAAAAESSATVQQAAYQVDVITAGNAHSECSADRNGASATTTFATAFFSDNQVPQVKSNYSPAPNTTVTTGFGETLVLNEQVPLTTGQTTGIRVNAMRIHRGSLDIIVAQSVCTVEDAPTSVHTTLSASPGSQTGFAGVPVGYTYTEVNDGTRPLANVTVTDDNCSPVALDSGDDDSDGVLDPGETWFFSCTAVFPTAGAFTSNVTATGTDPATGQVHVEHAATEVFINNMPIYDPATGEWIDPSGNVCASTGARVALSRSSTRAGPFELVPAGSDVMSPGNRNNPDRVRADGSFRWDVVAGFYSIRLTADTGESVDSDVFQIPPPATGIALRLPCPVPRAAPPAPVATATPSAGLSLTG